MGAYARDKNTSARLCAKIAGGAYARRGGRTCENYSNSNDRFCGPSKDGKQEHIITPGLM